MRLHSYNDLVTNSSTQTNAMAVNKREVYAILQRMLDSLDLDVSAEDLYVVEEVLDDENRFVDWVFEVFEGKNKGMDEKYPLSNKGKDESWVDYRVREKAVVAQMVSDGVVSQEDYKKDRLSDWEMPGYDSHYSVTKKETGESFNITDSLFDIESYYNG